MCIIYTNRFPNKSNFTRYINTHVSSINLLELIIRRLDDSMRPILQYKYNRKSQQWTFHLKGT